MKSNLTKNPQNKANKAFGKNLLVIIPIIILIAMLFFVDRTHRFFKNSTYDFIYNTNKESIRKYAAEIAIVGIDDSYADNSDSLYLNMLFFYNSALGEKESVASFLMDQNMRSYYGNAYNEDYLTPFLNKQTNLDIIKAAVQSKGSGDILLTNDQWAENFYYQYFTDGQYEFYLFMCIDRSKIALQINADEIIIPICIIGLLLILVTEYAIWLRMNCPPEPNPTHDLERNPEPQVPPEEGV